MNSFSFTEDEIREIRSKLQQGTHGRSLYWRLMNNAEWLLRTKIPSCPPKGPVNTQKEETKFGHSTYRDDYLLVHESFDIASSAFEGAILVLGLAYRISGDARYWARLEEWIEEYNSWDYWGPQAHPCDQFAVRIVSGMVYYHMLCKGESRLLNYEKMRYWYKQILDMFGGINALGEANIEYLGNHSWFNISMLGIIALFLGENEVADICLHQIELLTEWAIGEDGDYLDLPHYLSYALRYALPFLFLYKENRGTPHPNWEKIRRGAWFELDITPNDIWVAPILYTASVTNDRGLAYMAEHMRIVTWELHDDDSNRLFSISDSPWCCIFYNPEVQPAVPSDAPSMRLYREAGYAVYGSLKGNQSTKAILFAGPHSGKSYYNQGFISLAYNGESIISEPPLFYNSYITAHAWQAHYGSNMNDFIGYIDDMGQCAGTYPYEWPDNRYTHHQVTPPIGQIVQAESDENHFSAIADISKAYACDAYDFSFWQTPTIAPERLLKKEAKRVKKYTRSISIISENCAVIENNIEFLDGKTFPADLFLPTLGEVEVLSENTLQIHTGKVVCDMHISASAPFRTSISLYYMHERAKRIGIHFEPGLSNINCKCVLEMHIKY